MAQIIILAGKRHGRLDPMAAARGVSHKCMVPVRGEAMIGRVLRTVAASFPDAPISVVIEDFSAIVSEPTVARLTAAGRLSVIPAAFNLVDSVALAVERGGVPALITTGDNVLATRSALTELAAQGARSKADALIVLARKEAIRAAHPGGKSRYYEFRDGGFSNCNLFYLRTANALRAAEAFRGGGQFLKVKGRILATFGLLNLIRFKLGIFTVAQMLRSISRRLGARIEPLVMDDGRLAIDVDDERSLEMVEDILDQAIPLAA